MVTIPLDFTNLTYIDLLEIREQLLAQEEEIDAAMSVLKEEMIHRLEDEGVNGKPVGTKTLSIQLSYTTTKETAKELGAIKTYTSERIDTGMIRELHFKGIEIPNLTINKTLMVRDIQKEKKENEE